MTVTKQQQLERISRIIPKWNDAYLYAELMTNPSINVTVYRFTDNPYGDNAFITREEWQQERDKMQKQEGDDVSTFHFVDDEVLAANIEAMKALGATLVTPRKNDNSWHERGELPPVGCAVDVTGDDVAYGYGEVDCEVLAHVEDCAVIRMSFGLGCFVAKVLSPSRTEREKAIDAACVAVGGVGEDGLLIIERLYDAGMLK